MRLAWGRSILTAVALMALVLAAASAQQANEEAKRKLKSRINPVLPDVARRMGLTGKVRIEVTIAPYGRLQPARAILCPSTPLFRFRLASRPTRSTWCLADLNSAA